MRAFRIAYDGRPYHGFQRQPSVPTVEDALLSALADLGIAGRSGTGRDPDWENEDRPSGSVDPPPGYAAAGRTDAGVSALAQTVAFEAPDWCRPRALNAELPASIRAWASADAPAEFHATHDATSRAYRYFVHAPDLSADRVRTVLARLEGTHDFHNLTAVTDPEVETTRTVRETAVHRDGEFLALRIRAEGFLHEMVRRIVTLVEGVARDRSPVGVERALSGEELTGPEGIAPADPGALVLIGVEYPDLTFEVDQRGIESRRSVFDRNRVRAATRARVSEAIAGGDGGDGGGGGQARPDDG